MHIVYSNYCMFDTTSQKQFQNSQLLNDPKVQTLNSVCTRPVLI